MGAIHGMAYLVTDGVYLPMRRRTGEESNHFEICCKRRQFHDEIVHFSDSGRLDASMPRCLDAYLFRSGSAPTLRQQNKVMVQHFPVRCDEKMRLRNRIHVT